jgi:hypothetical protein
LGTGSREENASKQEARASDPIQSERKRLSPSSDWGSDGAVASAPLFPFRRLTALDSCA